MPTPRNRLAPSPIEDNPVGWESIYPPPPGRVITNPSPEFSPLAPSTYMTAAQKVGRFFNAATGRAKPYTVADLLGLTQAGNEAYDAAAGFLNSTNPIRAYHGSPHTFDRFDLSKINTGEGAQAYGHGLYFAGNEGVARGYRDALSANRGFKHLGFNAEIGGKVVDPASLDERLINAILEVRDAGSIAKARELVPSLYLPRGQKPALDALDRLEAMGGVTFKNPGSMYEVNLRTSPERLLDWDKPLSQQPIEARNIADTLARIPPQGLAPKSINTGADIYNSMRNPRAAKELGFKNWSSSGPAQYLKETGIDGIQYLDAGSRAAGEGSRNYVMFRDDIIDILKRYGLLGMIGGGAATGNRLAPQGEQ